MSKLAELGERALVSDRFRRVFVNVCLVAVGALFADIVIRLVL